MDASLAVFISQPSRILVQDEACSKDYQPTLLKHPASSQEEHGAPAGTRTPIDGLGNRSSIQLSYRSAQGRGVLSRPSGFAKAKIHSGFRGLPGNLFDEGCG